MVRMDFGLTTIEDLDAYLAKIKGPPRSKYPTGEMDVGQKFSAPKRNEGGIRSSVRYHQMKFPGRRFVVHTEGDSVVVVRIA